MITPAEVVGIHGEQHVEGITLDRNGVIEQFKTDYFIPLFGLTPKLGAIANWGLEIEKNAIILMIFRIFLIRLPGIQRRNF